jgi:mono/diheme cytochrome c family protein
LKDGCWWRAAPRIALVAAAVAAIAGCSGGSRRHAAPVGSRVTLPVLDPVTIALGRRIYVQNCASCHGERAEGAPHWQQPNARGDLPAPPHDDTGHTWRHDDAMLSQVIKDGLRDPFNKTRELTMPPFGKMLSDAEMADIIVYFKSLWSPEHRIYQEELSRPRQMPKRSR